MIESDLFKFLPTSSEKEIFLHDLLLFHLPKNRCIRDLFSFFLLYKRKEKEKERERERESTSTVNNNKRAIKQERLNQPPTCTHNANRRELRRS